MMMINIYKGKRASHSALELSKALNVKIIKYSGSKYKAMPHKLIINWGSTELPVEYNKSRVLNHPNVLATTINKFSFFNTVNGLVSIPPFTDDKDKVKQWLNDGDIVLARLSLVSSGGKHIKVMENSLDFVDAPCYTKYIPKKKEYRIHFMNGKPFYYQRKLFKKENLPEGKEPDWLIRSHSNGFVFSSNPNSISIIPEDVLLQAHRAIQALSLDFGALDIIYNESQDRAYVLEVNSAPGLEEKTLQAYVNQFKSEYKECMN